jgi:hypothetical protein
VADVPDAATGARRGQGNHWTEEGGAFAEAQLNVKGFSAVPWVLAAALLVWGAAVSAATQSWPARLTAQDKERIAIAACGSSTAVAASSMVATTTTRGSSRNTVDVRCPPHGSLGRSAIAHVTTCSNAQGAWRCEAGDEAILVRLSNATVVPVIATNIPPLQAVVLITAASKEIVPPFHTPAVTMLRGQCRISPNPKTPSPDMQQFDIRCTGTSMQLTKLCWSGGCRYFIPQGEGY